MIVSELLRRLSYGELSNLAMGSEGDGTVNSTSQAKLISYINDGLTRLYSKFVLKESYLLVEIQSFITRYQLTKRHALSSAAITGVTRYIQDTTQDPFLDDVIKVMRVTNIEGVPVELNDVGNCYSLFTPQPNVLEVPFPEQGVLMNIDYQARHVPLNYTDTSAFIDIPVVLEEALQAYVGHKVFFHMNGQDNGIKAAGYMKIYEMLCAQVIERDLVNSSTSTSHHKFHCRGFV